MKYLKKKGNNIAVGFKSSRKKGRDKKKKTEWQIHSVVSYQNIKNLISSLTSQQSWRLGEHGAPLLVCTHLRCEETRKCTALVTETRLISGLGLLTSSSSSAGSQNTPRNSRVHTPRKTSTEASSASKCLLLHPEDQKK